MTTDLTYRTAAEPPWSAIIEELRCTAANDARRCQLIRDHDGPHAYAWLVFGTPWEPRLIRWGAGNAWEAPIGSGPLPWCCMFRD